MVCYLMRTMCVSVCVWTQLSVLISPCDKCVSFGTSVRFAHMCDGTIHNTFHLLAFSFLQKTIDRLAVLWCWWLSNEYVLFQAIWQQYLKIDMALFRSSPVHISCIINVIHCRVDVFVSCTRRASLTLSIKILHTKILIKCIITK